jgi:hypothetical protein
VILIDDHLVPDAAFAIHCWDCSSFINPGCGDPFRNDSFDKIDCDQVLMPHLEGQKATLCRKIIQKGLYEKDISISKCLKSDLNLSVHGSDVPQVIRGCGWIVDDSVNKDCVRRSGLFSATVEYCTCDQDGCNAGTSLSATIISTLLIVFGFMRCVQTLM